MGSAGHILGSAFKMIPSFMLVQDTERTLEIFLSTKRGGEVTSLCTEQRAKIFHRKLLPGDVRGAVRYLTDSEKGGILIPGDVHEKSGDSVAEALESKHPHAWILDASSLPKYTITPDFVDVDICEEAVETGARRHSGSAGLGGMDSHALQHWLLRFGVASWKLHTAVAEFTDWLSNGFLPWPAYRALMVGRLVVLDKCPRIWPLDVGKTWRWAIDKTLLLVTGNEAREGCGIDQLCPGLEAGIKGGIHAMMQLWELHRQEEE
jgi:hypothetical protein